MLTLTRSDGEMIVLTDTRTGEQILMRIHKQRRGGGAGWKVGVSIQAPPHVRIDRAEKLAPRPKPSPPPAPENVDRW